MCILGSIAEHGSTDGFAGSAPSRRLYHREALQESRAGPSAVHGHSEESTTERSPRRAVGVKKDYGAALVLVTG